MDKIPEKELKWKQLVHILLSINSFISMPQIRGEFEGFIADLVQVILFFE